MANKEYRASTTYTDIEDFKRLDFIVKSITDLHKPDAKILDIGCGNGNVSLALGFLGYQVTGGDIDPVSIEIAKSRNTYKNVNFIILNADFLNTTNTYDAVVCSEVLEHLDEPGHLVKTIHKVLKADGILIATVPNGYGPRELFITRPMQYFNRKGIDKPITVFKKLLGYSSKTLQSSNEDLTHIQFFSVNSFERLILSAGFKLVDFKNADFLERTFPFSLLTRRSKSLQMLDCRLADYLPRRLTSGFYTSWTKTGQ
jgi:2-polyprenyl-3-methyl-5-hydroxy-6-metoxy-1,4-benzoquinol methylase